MERLSPRPGAETARGILKNPPRVILIFDNYRGQSNEALRKSELTMLERGITAMRISRAPNLYTESNRPKFVCFAGEHTNHSEPGSEALRRILLGLGAEESEIETRATTITTTTDITQLHSYLKEDETNGPASIVTSDDHVQRTEQEIVNHFSKHRPGHPVPQLYVVSFSTPEMQKLRLPAEVINSELFSQNYQALVVARKDGTLSGGGTEKIARFLSQIPARLQRDTIQRAAELLNHQHTPDALRRINKVKGQFRKGHKSLYVKKVSRLPKPPYILPPC